MKRRPGIFVRCARVTFVRCAHCDSEYVHHDIVEVFERTREDGPTLRAEIQKGQVTVDRDGTGNPSSRRHGLAVGFWCEQCDGRTVLTLAQHKGQTELFFAKAVTP